MKETIAGVIFLSLWIIGLTTWGESKNIKPDLRAEDVPCRVQGHPLWNDC